MTILHFRHCRLQLYSLSIAVPCILSVHAQLDLSCVWLETIVARRCRSLNPLCWRSIALWKLCRWPLSSAFVMIIQWVVQRHFNPIISLGQLISEEQPIQPVKILLFVTIIDTSFLLLARLSPVSCSLTATSPVESRFNGISVSLSCYQTIRYWPVCLGLLSLNSSLSSILFSKPQCMELSRYYRMKLMSSVAPSFILVDFLSRHTIHTIL